MQRHLIIMTRYPVAGQTKTRLIPALGAEGAASLQREMTEHLVESAWQFARSHHVHLSICFAGGTSDQMESWLGTDLTVRPQAAGNLGQRMRSAFAAAFADGAQQVVMIGADCPLIDATVLQEAFAAVGDADVVLGPAADGGYYLIGMKRLQSALFVDMPWGSSSVLEQTRRAATAANLVCRELATLRDIDLPADLPVWQACAHRRPHISIVIPVLNERSCLVDTLRSTTPDSSVEVVVVDGGSDDDTCSIAEQFAARVVTAAPGRAHQMNVGAASAYGDYLLFLHGDTTLPPGYRRFVRTTLADSQVATGAFTLKFDRDKARLRFVARWANRRSRWLRLPYGDQALFMRAETFRHVGEYPELPIMEDYALVRKLAGIGRIVTVPAAVTTSARRWNRLGVVRATAINQLLLAAYHCGVPVDRLASIYGRNILP